LLESVEGDAAKSQRHLAAELGIALGLVNAYLKRCIQKGLVKATQAPARRYAYYLTPQGFVEKSRLSVEYLTYSFSFFRQAKSDCSEALEQAVARGFKTVALAGVSELAEVTALCARDIAIDIVGVVDGRTNLSRFAGFPVVRGFEDAAGVDAVIVTDLVTIQETIDAAAARFGVDRVLVPALLRRSLRSREVAS
jgi:DNA-binding MarR family transcriptional regulator